MADYIMTGMAVFWVVLAYTLVGGLSFAALVVLSPPVEDDVTWYGLASVFWPLTWAILAPWWFGRLVARRALGHRRDALPCARTLPPRL